MNRTICVLGGGPAGLSCALWIKYLGLTPIIVEKSAKIGGVQQTNHYPNSWYMGLYGKTGPEFIKEFIRHAEVEMLPTLLNATLHTMRYEGDDFRIQVGRTTILAKAIVICTGQHVKQYEYIQAIEGSTLLQGSPQVCFHPGATPLRIPYLAGQRVAVVGGGDNGLSTAAAMFARAEHVHLFVQSTMHGFGAYQQRVRDGMGAGKITLHQPAQLRQFAAKGDQLEITFANGAGRLERVAVDFICFRIGFAPNVQELQHLVSANGIGPLALTASGHIKTDAFCRTSLPRIYAAGDVANPRDPCVATAVAQGTIAARSVDEDLRTLCWPVD